jgi:hypothetical protein
VKKSAIVVGLLVIGAIWGASVTFLSIHPDTKTRVVVRFAPRPKVTAKSDVTQLRKTFDRNFRGVTGHAAEVVWQNKLTGETEGEKYLFTMYGLKTEKLKRKARALLREDGWRRVTEQCRGLTRPDNRWSFGYCTYVDAPVMPEA